MACKLNRHKTYAFLVATAWRTDGRRREGRTREPDTQLETVSVRQVLGLRKERPARHATPTAGVSARSCELFEGR